MQIKTTVESQSVSRQLGAKSEELGGGKPNQKENSIFLNEVTVLAVLKLTGSEFQVEGAQLQNLPHFVRNCGTVNIFVLDDLSSLEF